MLEPLTRAMLQKLRRLGYGWVLLNGVLHAVAPKLMLKLAARLWLVGFENVGELEPRDWYATAMRAAGVGMIAAGAVGLLLDRPVDDDAEEEVDPVEIDTDSLSEETAG